MTRQLKLAYGVIFMKFFALAAAALAVSITGATADPIADRKADMKERGGLMRVLAPTAQGKTEFDAATILDALEKLNARAQAATDVAAQYPAGSEAGDTKAGPKIWSDREAFQEASDKFAEATAAAVAAAPQDLESFRAVFGPVGAGCGTCHEAFRL